MRLAFIDECLLEGVPVTSLREIILDYCFEVHKLPSYDYMGQIAELPNGDLLYQSGGTLKHITWDDGQPVRNTKTVWPRGDILTLACTNEKLTFARPKGEMCVWDLKSAKFVQAFETMAVGVTPLTNGTAAIWFGDKTVRVIELATGTSVFECNQSEKVSTVAALPNGKFAVGCAHNIVHIWTPSGGLRHILQTTPTGFKNSVLAICAFGDKLVSVCDFDRRVNVWDYETGKLVHTIEADGRVTAIATLPSGVLAVASLLDKRGKLQFWNPMLTECKVYSLPNYVCRLVPLQNHKLAVCFWVTKDTNFIEIWQNFI